MKSLQGETRSQNALGEALASLADSVSDSSLDKLTNAARLLEDTCDAGAVTVRNQPIFRALSALAYDAAAEPLRGERSYILLSQRASLPLDQWLESQELSRMFTGSLSLFGRRELPQAHKIATAFFEFLRNSPTLTERASNELILISSILTTIASYHNYIFSDDVTLSDFEETVKSFGDVVNITEAESWLSILGRLFLLAVQSAVVRSIVKLDIPASVKNALRTRNIIELWTPQAEAVEAGLLKGRNLVYATDTATGKSLLAYLASSNSTPSEKTVYIVPTRTLADEGFRVIRGIMPDVAVSTRERTDFDDRIADSPILVSTYEKFDALLRRGRLDASSVKRLIADEAHFIASPQRGIPLEFLLTRFKEASASNDPQIVAISGTVGKDEADAFASWLNASLVYRDWRPVDLDEMIYQDGLFYYKDGTIQTGPAVPQTQLPKAERRLLSMQLLVRQTLIRDGQCMVVVNSRELTEVLAQRISDWLETNAASFFDADLRAKLLQISENSKKLTQIISRTEPDLPVVAEKLVRFTRNGVAYHHAGVPSKYREIIENAIRDHTIRVVVTTTTFEAGVNLPVSRVIFPFPSASLRGRLRPLPRRTYANLAGRAGRPGLDKRGESIIIAITDKEREDLRDRYFTQRIEPLASAVNGFMRRRPSARYAVQSQILAQFSDAGKIEFQQLIDFIQKSWFWQRASEADRRLIRKHLSTEIWKLGIYGLVDERDLSITGAGRAAARSMLSPLSTVNLMRCCRRIFSAPMDRDRLDILLLSLVGVPQEVSSIDRHIKGASVAQEVEFVSGVVRQDADLKEPDRTELCAKYATVLWYWIKSYPAETILSKVGLNVSSDAAILEEELPNVAYWVLTSAASLPSDGTGASEEQRQRMLQLASYCKAGSSNDVVRELLGLGVKHIGRGTAIRLANFMQERRVGLKDLTLNDFAELFPDNIDCAELLYSELAQVSKRI